MSRATAGGAARRSRAPKRSPGVGAAGQPKGKRAPKLEGQASVELPRALFAEPFNEHLVHEAARAEQLARRRGTASTKGRGEVRGGGAKPWRQKGTGRARTGSIRAPHWTGGGTVFGPTPRRYTVKVNRRARRRALRAALSVHAARGSIAVVDARSFKDPSTGRAAQVLDRWGAERPVLALLAEGEAACALSFRNIDRVAVLAAAEAGIADIMGAASLIVSEAAVDTLARLAADDRTAA